MSSSQQKSPILGPWNANRRSRYVELLLVVDNREFAEHGRDLPKVLRFCKDVANVMNALYSPLNIYIALVGVVVWTEHDEITLSASGDTTLTNFLHYRRERLVKDHPVRVTNRHKIFIRKSLIIFLILFSRTTTPSS